MDQSLIRNFCIIAHIDHGKSTLADRLIEKTGTMDTRNFHAQILDDMDLERERGITIKASAIRLSYKSRDGQSYLLNLIDTPGHVDFSFEVSKSLRACEGALWVIDAAQGVEAQTVANLYLALDHDLEILPVINKIDLSNADPERVKRQIDHLLGPHDKKISLISAKNGTGVPELLERIVQEVKPPSGRSEDPLQALIVDSSFDTYRGVIITIRLFNGFIEEGMNILMMGTGMSYTVLEVGILNPELMRTKRLECGEVGYMTCNIRNAKEVVNGDTITNPLCPTASPMPGFRRLKPLVFAGLYPVAPKDFPALREAMAKMQLSDPSFVYEPESSPSVGFGFRCGFLGLLHMEVIRERLEREHNLNLIVVTPSVVYHVKKTDGTAVEIDNPSKLPALNHIREILEPFVEAYLLIPKDSLGGLLELCEQRRGEYVSTEYLDDERVKLVYRFPLAEIIVDFFDKVKSLSKGYGSLDYELAGYRPAPIVKLDILINGDPCDALSLMVHRDKAQSKGRLLAEKLKELIPRHLFEIAIQAVIGNKVIARETVKPVGKNVTAKCYGGDITRKRKLWERQKEGKKRMKQFGRVEIPQEAFLAALKIE